MPATKGKQQTIAKTVRGRPTKYRKEYAAIAEKLCARIGATDQQLADWFEVSVRTIHEWRLKHPEFSAACRVGKEETDDEVERATVQHITGYYLSAANGTGRIPLRSQNPVR